MLNEQIFLLYAVGGFPEATIRRMYCGVSVSETHMTKPMTDDASHPLPAANFCLFASPSPSINGPGAFRKDGRNDGKGDVFTKSNTFPYPRPFSICFLSFPTKDYRCFYSGRCFIFA